VKLGTLVWQHNIKSQFNYKIPYIGLFQSSLFHLYAYNKAKIVIECISLDKNEVIMKRLYIAVLHIVCSLQLLNTS
jgi:hypothetical protein